MKTTLVLASLLTLATAVPPLVSATHNVCHNEPADINLGIVGGDGPILQDGNGEQICVGGDDDFYEIKTTPPAGTGVVLRVCFANNDAYGACNEAMGNDIILDYTGVSLFCSTTLSACIWVNGAMI